MKKILTIIIAWLYIAQLSAIDASVSYAAFKSPAQSYVEIYLHIIGAYSKLCRN